MLSTARVLPFDARDTRVDSSRVGRVHRDGSITFRGKTYATIKDVPADCQALRPDLETHREWRRLYRAIDPDPRPRYWPRWLLSS